MRVLVAHNHYQQPGGEDAVVRDEVSLLKHFGHEVALYERGNEEISSWGLLQKFKHLARLDWSQDSYRQMRSEIQKFKPDIVHFHNTFFIMTPAVYSACQDEGVSVVQSLHNFRMMCANGLFFRDGHVCEDCTNISDQEGIRHACYRKSRLLTYSVTRMSREHRQKGTWQRLVSRYITATEFTRRKYIEQGIPADRIIVKPHFVYPDPGFHESHGGYAFYAGRLSEEKGVHVLLKAWEKIKDFPLKILGDGPLAEILKNFAREKKLSNVEFLGYLPGAEYEKQLSNASFVVVPSICYENFPRMVVESYARGIPVIATRLGSMAEIVTLHSGRLFDAGNADQLAAHARAWIDNPGELMQMRPLARKEYELRYTVQKNYEQLMNIYQAARQQKAVNS